MIHILQSVSNMDRGGIESMLMNYYRHLDRTRFQFDFLVNKKKPGFFDDEIRALGGRIFQSPGVAPQSYPAYLRSMQQLLAQHPEIKVLHAHNEAMQLFALEGAKKAGLPVRIAHAHNTRLPKDAKLPIKWFCKQFIPGAATDYWACGREAGIYYFGQSAWDARGVTLRNAIDLDRFGYRPQVRAKLRAEYGLNDKLVVGCVARLMAQKNHTRLLDIFAALKKVRPDSCLLLVGEGELRLVMLSAMGLGALLYVLALSPLLRPLWDFWLSAAAATARLLWRPVSWMAALAKKIAAAGKKAFPFRRKCAMIKKKTAKEASTHGTEEKSGAPHQPRPGAADRRAGDLSGYRADTGGTAPQRGQAAAGGAGAPAANADPGEPGAGVRSGQEGRRGIHQGSGA